MASLITLKVRIEGLQEIREKLQILKRQSTRNKVMRRALTAATKPVLESMRDRCPTGQHQILRRALGRITKTYRGSTIVVILGVRRGFKTLVGFRKTGKHAFQPVYEDPALIAHLVERGHGGPHPAPPHPFARPAWDEHKSRVPGAVAAEAWKGIKEELGK